MKQHSADRFAAKVKRATFHITKIPFLIVALIAGGVYNLLLAIVASSSASYKVFHVVLDRYEHWAFELDGEYSYYSPWKHSLTDYWVTQFKHVFARGWMM